MVRWSRLLVAAFVLALVAAGPLRAQGLDAALQGKWTADPGGDCGVQSFTFTLTDGMLSLADTRGRIDTQRIVEQRAGGIATKTATSTHGIRIGASWVYELLAPGQLSMTEGETGQSANLRRCREPMSASATPEQVLRRIYDSYAAEDEANLPLTSEATMRAFFVPGFADKLVAYASRTGRVDKVCISEDPFIAGQDYKLSDIDVQMGPATADHATGSVSFRNFGKPAKVRIDLQRTPVGWRIADLFAKDGHSFRSQLIPCVG